MKIVFLLDYRFGEWSRVGCRTELGENWFISDDGAPLIVNCTCNHLSTFAVLVDVVDLEVSWSNIQLLHLIGLQPCIYVLILFFQYIPEPSLLEDVTSYSCFTISLPLLLAAYLILALIRGLQTNSNTIRKNLVLCVFLAELIYFIALKARKPMVSSEVRKVLSNLLL